MCEGVRMRKIIAEYFPLLWGTFVQSEETNPDYVRAGLLCAWAWRPITENLHYNLVKASTFDLLFIFFHFKLGVTTEKKLRRR